MPFTGGAASSPERYGGGVAGNKPLVQLVYQSVAAARGSAYSQTWPPATAVDFENFAAAKAIAIDGYGGNQRLTSNFDPNRCGDAPGLLPRWEKIFGIVPLATDTLSVRRARVAAGWLRIGAGSMQQVLNDQVQANLGPLFGGITYNTPANALSWWPGLSGTAAGAPSTTSGVTTVSGLSGVPSAAGGALLTLSNCATSANNGAWQVHGYVSSTSVGISTGSTFTAPDYGVGGTSGSPTIVWLLSNPAAPWMSSIANVEILALLPSGYYTLVGGQQVPNAAWYQAVAALNPVLDVLLPAWVTWTIYVDNSGGTSGFLLDEPNIGLEVFS
jgi:hypothetical protein